MANTSQLAQYRRSRRYVPVDPPVNPDFDDHLRDVISVIWEEFSKLRVSIDMAHDHDALVHAPQKPRDSQVRFADGPPGWDPGLGRGPYWWDEQTSQWVKMSGQVSDPVGNPPSSGLADHGLLGGLGDDDHPQYLNVVRGDARYYTETELNGGALDPRYYTEAEIDALLAAISEYPSDKVDLQLEFKVALGKGYAEYTYTSGELTQIDVWEDNTKATKLFTKVFTYTSGDLTEIELTDEVSSLVLTKTFTYVSGELTTKTEIVT